MSTLLMENDKKFIIATSDKKCIIRGGKYSKYVLATLDEPCGNYKLFTCRHGNQIVRNLSRDKDKKVYLTDTVRELYGVDSRFYSTKELPNLIPLEAQVAYKVEI